MTKDNKPVLSAEQKKEKNKEFLLNYALYFVLGLMILFIIIYDPSFLSVGNFWNILRQSSTRGIMALGVAGLIVLQGTDLSAGRIMGLCAAISASMLQSVNYASRMYPNLGEINMMIPLLLAIICGAIFGLINGFGVAVLKVHAFIITLGTQLIAYGLLQIYINSQALGAQPLGSLADNYSRLVLGNFMGIPNLVWFLIITAVVMYVIWNKTTGRVIGGHQRLKILLSMGMDEIECVVVEMDEQKEKALNIALNNISGD